MHKLFATYRKDLLLLWRDRAGLLVLFVMPAVLVLIITLVQENVHKLMGETDARVILIDNDRGGLGRQIIDKMSKIDLVTDISGKKVDVEEALALVAAGGFQACIVVPAGLSVILKERSRREVIGSLTGEKFEEIVLPPIKIYFDPAVLGGFRSAIENSLKLGLFAYEIGEKIHTLARQLPIHVENEMKESAGNFASLVDIPDLNIDLNTEPLLVVSASSASLDGLSIVPTPIQHNVPAWALFGMFFIVVPMAGSLIKERQQGTLSRLLTMPAPYTVILGGKLAAYATVCFCQFTLIVLIGKFVLPVLGTDIFVIGEHVLAAALVVFAATLAATGYGIMLGTVSRTYEQASMFGAISVVAASAIGGVMVPVYAMPEIMQKISIISPVGWGLAAFLDVFVRGGNVSVIGGELLLLLSFALCTFSLSWLIFSRRANGV